MSQYADNVFLSYDLQWCRFCVSGVMSQYADDVFLSYDLQWCRFCVCGTFSPLANIVTKFKDCMVIFL